MAVFPFPSFLVLCDFTAVRSFKVLPVCLALAVLDCAEELLDERFGFCFNCGNTERTIGDESLRGGKHKFQMIGLLTLAFPLTPPLGKKVR